MKFNRIVVSHYGGPGVLQMVEEEIPEPPPGHVRVKIRAAGVAWGDILKRGGLGARTPFTPGYDLVGTVDKTSDGVSSVSVGDTVAALPLSGGYAGFICLPASELVQVPADVDPAQAVCLVMNYVVAHQLLHRCARVQPGERILVHSAAGGVGTALLQLGNLAGLEMYGTASSGKHELVAGLGGTPIDYRSEDFVERLLALTGDGVDAVFDPIGGASIHRSYRTLRRGGRLVVFGAHSILAEGKLKTVAGFMRAGMLHALPDGRRVLHYNLTGRKYSRPEWCREDLSELFDLFENGKIKPIIAKRLPLSEATRAHELLEKRSLTGKVVLIPD